ncbi:uncharacterized protein TEOVI_000805400 [Trypanosoma equiperdum]|uniref:Methyltransferase domain containing protein n=1 Tax=Trypanosoma equiperdum TaxID=5694 RepID=A0A1G4I0U0_TRYEQ|nr:hypothetical protein, conserved [Trypanosoma equiperdum]
MRVDVEAVFEKIRPALEVAEVGAWSKTDITTFMSLVSGFCDIQRQQLRARRGKRRDGHDCEQNVDKEGGCEDGCGVRGEDGDKEDEASLEADSVVVLEIRRSLTKLRHYLQKRIPYGSISEPVVPPAPTSPQEGENSCGGRGAYKALQSSKPVEPPVCAVDAFLYLEEDIDALADQGHISREYCRSCGSVDIGLCQFITHSFSLEQLIFLSCFLLPSFGDTSYCLTSDNFWRPRHKNCHTVAAAFSCEHVVEVGSRLGIVPMSCYFASEQQRLLNTRRVTAIELDKELVALQQEVFQKFAKGPTAVHLNLVHSDCFEGEGLEALRSADIIILHNIFEYFTASAEEHLRSWKRLRAAVVRSGQLLVSCPPLQETLAAFSEDCVRKVFINEQDKADFVHVHQSNSNAGRISRKRCRQPPQEHSFTLDQWWRSWVKEIDVEHIRRSFLTAQRFCEEDHPCDSSYGDADDELVKELKDMRVYMVQ